MTRSLWFFGFFLHLAVCSVAKCDERLSTLRAQFEAALSRIDAGYKDLDESFLNALAREMEAESSAGKLENALLFKNEIDTFKQVGFDKIAFEKRLSTNPALSRVQSAYLNQRNTLGRDLEPRKKDLVLRFDKELSNVQVELTKNGELSSALEAKKAQEDFRADPKFASAFGGSGANNAAVEGKVRFVTKGELELFFNGKPFSYRNEYKGSDSRDRITGETKGSLIFHADDFLVIHSRSSASFRGIIMAVVADDSSSCIPIRIEHLRYLGVGKDPAAVTLDSLKANSTGGISQGGNDPYMTPEWDRIKPTFAESNGSQWFRSETSNEWHSWGIIFSPEMVVRKKQE